MMLRSLFFRLLKEDGKRRIWTLALFTLVFLLILPIRCALEVERIPYMASGEYFPKDLLGLMNPVMDIITCISAIIIGLSSFFHLFHRKKVDLYHSLPVRREMLFATGYLNGILLYAIPYLINIAICFIILIVKDYMDGDILLTTIVAFAVNLLFYCLIYTITITAVMMTGNLIVSILGTAVLLLYGPLLLAIKEWYCQSFFKTYYSHYNINKMYEYLSPLFAYFGVIAKNSSKDNYSSLIMWAIIMLIICLGVTLLLYKKRPSEVAGKAMAFRISKPVFKFLLGITASLSGGILIRNFVSSDYDGWFLFGLLFSLIIAYALIQVIYDFDIRSAVRQKKQLLACFIITCAIAGIFRFDLLRFDSYVPDKKNIETMSVYISGIDNQIKGFDFGQKRISSIGDVFYHLDNMRLSEFSAAYELAIQGYQLNKTRSFKENNTLINNGVYYYIVKYTLKGNRTVFRRYQLYAGNNRELLNEIYNNKEYKAVHFPINQIDGRKILQVGIKYASDILNYTKSGTYSNGNVTLSRNTNSKDIVKLIDTYRDELSLLSVDEIADSDPVAVLSFKLVKASYDGFYVYPSFTNTIEMLNQLGFNTEKTIDISKITRITINKYSNIHYYDNVKNGLKSWVDVKTVSYNDGESIGKINSLLIDSYVYQSSSAVMNMEKDIQAIIEYNTGDNINQSFSYCFKQGQVPDFVLADLEKE